MRKYQDEVTRNCGLKRINFILIKTADLLPREIKAAEGKIPGARIMSAAFVSPESSCLPQPIFVPFDWSFLRLDVPIGVHDFGYRYS